MKNKDITNNELARMVKTGFDEMGKRFDGVDKGFEQVDKRFDRIDAQLDRMERNHEIIISKLDGNARRNITN